ncbi:related to aldehyde reductase II [Fusarium fujikuroi]|nr:related to aldehyde reductase II [Fusarium fujikuroi]SCO09365.1 related to aldehyde reductase II [Fusarium fujikuroi]SCO27975.1 related to aldehyde reductase II [Fusarium fujikuroi]SCV26013.1 related to aldehyde reductase II [Fusarium fujikuroi]
MRISEPAIPFGSTVVVIGANGYMGVETCEKLLQAGFSVRGTVRDVEKNRQWMHKLFDAKWPGMFELVHVADFEAEGAFDAAFKGAEGVIYVSTPIILNADPARVVDPVVKGTINSLEAAARAGVKRYVLSSSSKAVESTNYNHPHHITSSSMFNYDAIRKACSEPNVDGLDRFVDVYSASRALAELAFWSWVGTNQPPFVANCVVPDGQFGRALDTENTSSTFRMLKAAAEGEWDKVFGQVAYYTDVQDAARLLVAAVALPSIVNERIFSYCHNSTWNELRYKIRLTSLKGERLVKGKDQAVEGRDLSNAGALIKRAEDILRKIGQQGFASEEDILRDFLDSL